MGCKQSKLTQEEISELVKKTGFNAKEIREWHRGFLRDCPSGKLNKEEFQNVYANFFPNGDARNFAAHVFRTYDKNNDGSIDFKEFLYALSVTSHGSMEEKLKWAFELYDLNKDGTIEKAEMVELITAIYKMVSDGQTDPVTPEERASEIFRKMDKNQDSRLTYEEFLEGAKQDPSLLRFLECQN